MNTIRRTAALATATAVAAALTSISALAPTGASASRPDPLAGPATQCVGSAGGAGGAGGAGTADNAGTVDGAVDIAHRKALMAQDNVDNAPELQ